MFLDPILAPIARRPTARAHAVRGLGVLLGLLSNDLAAARGWRR